MSYASPPIVPGRSCDGCTMCCRLLGIEELNKPEQTPCAHCDASKGCRIYDTRPGECKTFYCGWLVDPNFSDAWRPSDCRMVIVFQPTSMIVVVDKGRRDTWRKEPYLTKLRTIAGKALSAQADVRVMDGSSVIQVLPDRELKIM